MQLKVIAMSHHRNGVCGAPFDCYIIKEGNANAPKVCIDFGADRFAVLDIVRLSEGDIAFGSNSWRGDHYASEVRKAGKSVKYQVADGALFIRYGLEEA